MVKEKEDRGLLFALRNWVRLHILGKPPLCPNCGEEMVRTGYPKDISTAFKCVPCSKGRMRKKCEVAG